MDEDGAKRVRVKRSDGTDWISNLPYSLIFDILLNIPTNDVVKTSMLSSRWKNLWRYIPGLDLNFCDDFPDYNTFVSFVDRFLGYNSELRLQNFKLKYIEPIYKIYGIGHVIERWIDIVVMQKVQYLHILDSYYVQLPPTLYTCESLVSLKLSHARSTYRHRPKFVSLPSLKVLDLTDVSFGDDGETLELKSLEMLISGCPVLEILYIHMGPEEFKGVLHVRSQSLLSFTYLEYGYVGVVNELEVVIDAPRLEYLRLYECHVSNFILNNIASLVKAVIEIDFYFSGSMFDPIYLPKLNTIRSLLVGISTVKDMVISSDTLEMFNDFSKFEELPIFCNLYSLRVVNDYYTWKMLPTFLEICPNLKSLVLGSTNLLKEGSTIPEPRCFLSSLEYVVIESPLKGDATEMKLVSYLLENSLILKKLTLRLDDSIKKEESAIFEELITIPRLSSSCQLVIL